MVNGWFFECGAQTDTIKLALADTQDWQHTTMHEGYTLLLASLYRNQIVNQQLSIKWVILKSETSEWNVAIMAWEVDGHSYSSLSRTFGANNIDPHILIHVCS